MSHQSGSFEDPSKDIQRFPSRGGREQDPRIRRAGRSSPGHLGEANFF